MSKDRLTPCKSYINEGGECNKGRTSEHYGYCQRCDKYEPRVKERHLNIKKQKLDKIKRKEIE